MLLLLPPSSQHVLPGGGHPEWRRLTHAAWQGSSAGHARLVWPYCCCKGNAWASATQELPLLLLLVVVTVRMAALLRCCSPTMLQASMRVAWVVYTSGSLEAGNLCRYIAGLVSARLVVHSLHWHNIAALLTTAHLSSMGPPPSSLAVATRGDSARLTAHAAAAPRARPSCTAWRSPTVQVVGRHLSDDVGFAAPSTSWAGRTSGGFGTLILPRCCLSLQAGRARTQPPVVTSTACWR
jgi:hypothetical protein